MINQVTYTGQLVFLSCAINLVLQFVADIKMVSNGALSAPGNNRYLVHPGSK